MLCNFSEVSKPGINTPMRFCPINRGVAVLNLNTSWYTQVLNFTMCKNRPFSCWFSEKCFHWSRRTSPTPLCDNQSRLFYVSSLIGAIYSFFMEGKILNQYISLFTIPVSSEVCMQAKNKQKKCWKGALNLSICVTNVPSCLKMD